MTTQRLFIAELSDILQVQLQCKCGAQFSYDPDKPVRLPRECPQCDLEWRDDASFATLDQQIVEGFMKALQKAREQQRANGRIKIKFTFEPGRSDVQ